MRLEEEKDAIYTQMRMILEERRRLSNDYYELKAKLFSLDNTNQPNSLIRNEKLAKKSSSNISEEALYQQYICERENKHRQLIAYSTISLTISSILKDAGRPLSNKEIYKLLISDHKLNISYKNLTHNILPKMNLDNSVNVERAYRGYWQYRLH
ncbi:hypothetical protein LI192_19085 [Enterococcus avium]|uniref:hypothetical protein n=1 Tax=Enterococcus avium TaxID=33945 RepID=UPI001D07239C|nr:hypothetical protein [Enterococcus avium]MCB6531465.1 hypothetical protein [Enterococcus avium]MCG4869234.1 hypothetical protein [Enterococcus avium]MCQ4677392.1 hypothetical protein [Enterococcus avium]